MKFALALIIVLRHIGQGFYYGNETWRVYIVNTVSTIGVPAFFVISGFLFFRKPADGERLKAQVMRILRLYGVWMILYLPINIYGYRKSGMGIANAFLDFVRNTFFSGSYYHLWYLPSLAVAMCLVYLFGKNWVIRDCF